MQVKEYFLKNREENKEPVTLELIEGGITYDEIKSPPKDLFFGRRLLCELLQRKGKIDQMKALKKEVAQLHSEKIEEEESV